MGTMTTMFVIIINIIFITISGTESHSQVPGNRTSRQQIAMDGGAADRNHRAEGQGEPTSQGTTGGGGGDTMGWGGGGGGGEEGPSSAAPY